MQLAHGRAVCVTSAGELCSGELVAGELSAQGELSAVNSPVESCGLSQNDLTVGRSALAGWKAGWRDGWLEGLLADWMAGSLLHFLSVWGLALGSSESVPGETQPFQIEDRKIQVSLMVPKPWC